MPNDKAVEAAIEAYERTQRLRGKPDNLASVSSIVAAVEAAAPHIIEQFIDEKVVYGLIDVFVSDWPGLRRQLKGLIPKGLIPK